MCLSTSVTALSRSFSAVSEAKFKMCVNGGTGQPMSVLMAMNPLVKDVIQDVTMAMVPQSRVDADLLHLENSSNIGFATALSQPVVDQLRSTFRNATLCLFPLICHKARYKCDDLFGINAGIAKGLLTILASPTPNGGARSHALKF